MIELRSLAKSYDGRSPSVEALFLTIATGEFLALVGPSGCGKTTTVSMINRLLDPSDGTVLIDGTDTRACDAVALRRRIGFGFQDIGLVPAITRAAKAGG